MKRLLPLLLCTACPRSVEYQAGYERGCEEGLQFAALQTLFGGTCEPLDEPDDGPVNAFQRGRRDGFADCYEAECDEPLLEAF